MALIISFLHFFNGLLSIISGTTFPITHSWAPQKQFISGFFPNRLFLEPFASKLNAKCFSRWEDEKASFQTLWKRRKQSCFVCFDVNQEVTIEKKPPWSQARLLFLPLLSQDFAEFQASWPKKGVVVAHIPKWQMNLSPACA